MSVKALSKLYSVTQLIDHSLSAYTAGDALGSKFAIPVNVNSGRGIFLHEIRVIDPEPQTNTNGIKVQMFRADFTATADNAPWVITTAADALNYLGVASNANTDYTDFTTSKWDSIDVSRSLDLAGMNLYIQCVAVEAFDSTAASKIKIELVYERLN